MHVVFDRQLGKRMQKEFGKCKKKMYRGTVVAKDQDKKSGKTMYKVRYDDGDCEDLFPGELRDLLYDELTAQKYIAMRDRAIKLFKHYPVLSFKIKPGHGTAESRFFRGHYHEVKIVPHTPTTDSFEEMFGNTFKLPEGFDLYDGSRLTKWFRQGTGNKLGEVPYPKDSKGRELPHGAILHFHKVPARYCTPFFPLHITSSIHPLHAPSVGYNPGEHLSGGYG